MTSAIRPRAALTKRPFRYREIVATDTPASFATVLMFGLPFITSSAMLPDVPLDFRQRLLGETGFTQQKVDILPP